MKSEGLPKDKVVVRPVTAQEWPDLQALFAESGPQNGCWCMYWRITRARYHQHYGQHNQNAMQAIIQSGRVPGLLAYLAERPIAWCSIAPREEFPTLDRSPTLKRIDHEPVWSIVCFFISKPFRQSGLSKILIEAAIEYARASGARIVEAYPLVPEKTKYPQYERYTGVWSTFQKAGFRKVSHRSGRRPIVRYDLHDRP